MRERIWEAAFDRWARHYAENHEVRAALWGWVADRVADLFDRIGWGQETE